MPGPMKRTIIYSAVIHLHLPILFLHRLLGKKKLGMFESFSLVFIPNGRRGDPHSPEQKCYGSSDIEDQCSMICINKCDLVELESAVMEVEHKSAQI